MSAAVWHEVPLFDAAWNPDDGEQLGLFGGSVLAEVLGSPRREGCYCPSDCNCHYDWKTTHCGCKAH